MNQHLTKRGRMFWTIVLCLHGIKIILKSRWWFLKTHTSTAAPLSADDAKCTCVLLVTPHLSLRKTQDQSSVCFVHIGTFLITMGSSEGREVDTREGGGGGRVGNRCDGGERPPLPAAHSRHNVTLYNALHLVRGSSQPYMVMSITLVADESTVGKSEVLQLHPRQGRGPQTLIHETFSTGVVTENLKTSVN